MKIDGGKPPEVENRVAHGLSLKQAIQDAEAAGSRRREAVGFYVRGAKPGIYVEFESLPGVPLNLNSLEDRRRGIELVAV
jgi:hypothetical protein